jgi:uncharacterized membrane protein HdeD (DUF308 family)
MTALELDTKQSPWWLVLMGGILNIIIGVLLLTVPVKTVVVLVIALGIYWLVSGVFILVGMFIDHSAWGWKLIAGLLSIIAGIVILRYPLISSLLIPQLVVLYMGILAVIEGIVMLILAFKGGGWGAGILGALAVILGIILILAYGNIGTGAALVWATGIIAIIAGIGQLFQAFRQKAD